MEMKVNKREERIFYSGGCLFGKEKCQVIKNVVFGFRSCKFHPGMVLFSREAVSSGEVSLAV